MFLICSYNNVTILDKVKKFCFQCNFLLTRSYILSQYIYMYLYVVVIPILLSTIVDKFLEKIENKYTNLELIKLFSIRNKSINVLIDEQKISIKKFTNKTINFYKMLINKI